MGELVLFLEQKIATLTETMQEAEDQEEWSTVDYLAGCIDAYDIIRMRLTGTE